jgi:hypothetical protein
MRAKRPFEERRSATRFGRDEDTDFAVLKLSTGKEMVAMVFDESLGGISVVIDDVSPLPVGAEVQIVYAGFEAYATVIHVRPLIGGRSVVGFATHAGR